MGALNRLSELASMRSTSTNVSSAKNVHHERSQTSAPDRTSPVPGVASASESTRSWTAASRVGAPYRYANGSGGVASNRPPSSSSSGGIVGLKSVGEYPPAAASAWLK